MEPTAGRLGRDPGPALPDRAARWSPRTSRSWPRYVDEKMRPPPTSPDGRFLQMAVLAALNIADEYFRVRRRAAQPAPVAQRARELERLLDAALGSDTRVSPPVSRGP